MTSQQKKELWVRVEDKAGNAFICPLNALKDQKSATEEELENCVDDAVTGRYAGNIEVIDRK